MPAFLEDTAIQMDDLQQITGMNSRCCVVLTELSFAILLFQMGRSNRNYCS